MTIRNYIAAIALTSVMVTLPLASGYADDAKKLADYPVLEKLRGTDAALAYDYLGKKYGLDAWLLSGPELMQIVYVLPESKSAIVGGTLVTADGKEASSELLQNFMQTNAERSAQILEAVHPKTADKDANKAAAQSTAKPAAKSGAVISPSEKFWQDLSVIGGVSFGENKESPEIFAVLDPAQTDTKMVWNLLAPLAEKGHLRVTIVPLAATSADSIMDVAYVLGASEPQQAWSELMKGVKPDAAETPETHGVLRMKAIVDMAQALNLRQLPLLVYRAADGQKHTGAVRVVRGAPKNWVALFTEMGLADAAIPADDQ